MNTKQTFNNEAEIYEQTSRAVNIFFDESLDALVNSINLTNKNKIRILDVCCGTGILTQKVAKQYPKAEFVGLDFAENMLVIAKARMKDYNFTAHCIDVLDTQSITKLGKFDLIISSFGIHNIHGFAEKQIAINNIYSALKPNGQYFVLDYIKGQNKKECEHYTKTFINFLRKTYNKKETKEWINLLAEEDEPETVQDNFNLLSNANFKEVKLLWQKEYIAIIQANK